MIAKKGQVLVDNTQIGAWAIAFLTVVGLLTSAWLVIAAAYGAFLTLNGVMPVLVRLGKSLSRRKIAIYARGDRQDSLMHMLIDSKLFSAKRIVSVQSEADFGRAEGVDVLLVYWPDWKDAMPEILANKSDAAALVIYTPHSEGPVPQATIKLLEAKRNVVLNQFRGRLINDILISMITSGYEKR